MADLKTDYKDDVLDTTQNTKRKYQMIDNGDGTVSFEDVTEYLQQGDSFGADDTNATNTKVNALETDIGETNTKVNALETDIGETNIKVNALETDIGEINDNLTEYDYIDDRQTVGSFTTSFRLQRQGKIVSLALTVRCTVNMGGQYHTVATLPIKPKHATPFYGKTLSGGLTADLTIGTEGKCQIYVYGTTPADDFAKFNGVYFTDD